MPASICATISLGLDIAASTWPPISAAVTSPPELQGTYFTDTSMGFDGYCASATLP